MTDKKRPQNSSDELDDELELEELPPEPAPADPLAAIQAQLLEEQAKAEKYWDALVRMKAEVENIQRRAKLDIEKTHKFGLEKCILELLPVVDSLETGLETATSSDASVAAIRDGMSLTLKLLVGTLQKFGATALHPEGEAFDPSQHEAMSMLEVAGAKPNTVLTVVQKGYMLNGRLIRPARVVVSRPKAS